MTIMYPYPSQYVNAPSFVTIKLSDRDMYGMWKTQMKCLLTSHGMLGFIDGRFGNPRWSSSSLGKENEEDYALWVRSDSLVKGWILGSLSIHALRLFAKNIINEDFSAKDAWDKLHKMYGPVDIKRQEEATSSGFAELDEQIVYPYPSQYVNAPSFVTIKLSDRDMYGMWKTQMKCLLTSHGMLGFIDGRFGNPRWSSSSLGKEKEEDYALWVRSDSLVKGWILGSLSIHALRLFAKNIIDEDFSAKDAWDKLHKMYGPVDIKRQEEATSSGFAFHKNAELDDQKEMETRGVESIAEEKEMKTIIEQKKRAAHFLYNAIKSEDLDAVNLIVSRLKQVQLTDKITMNGNTALHVAVSITKNTAFLTKLLEGVTDATQLEVRNSEGSTPLHVAAIVGNTKAAEMLVGKNKDVLLAKDNEGQIPLARALSNMHSDTYLYLMDQTKSLDREMDIITTGAHELVVNAISSKDFVSANKLYYSFRPDDIDAILMAVAQNFPSELNIWERMAYSVWPFKLLLPKVEQYNTAVDFLLTIYYAKGLSTRPNSITKLIFEATRQNVVQVVQIIMKRSPNAIWFVNEDGHNIIQYSVLNRSENVYNLVYQMSEQKNIYKTIKDSSGNNLLHLAARLAPPNKLSLISGEALQIQRELQWFEEVKKFVCPLNVLQKNSFEETPQMVFTREHKDLVIEGEKWMKDTAASYTITAALITTIMFAAAITVPGGNNQDSGIPTFTNKSAFTVFAVSVAISLLSSVTSLIMFLSILTARFAEQDFLLRLPTKLIIGLVTLFISTTTMIIAFGVTMFLVFGKSDSSVLVHIAIWSCLPIACFVKFHFPLISDLISATYGVSIFGKKSDKTSNLAWL